MRRVRSYSMSNVRSGRPGPAVSSRMASGRSGRGRGSFRSSADQSPSRRLVRLAGFRGGAGVGLAVPGEEGVAERAADSEHPRLELDLVQDVAVVVDRARAVADVLVDQPGA